ncbi:hypothetical protein HNP52_003973 [Sphingomonas kyeonggiensis]|uniref:Uncharacterized protein n=1 Tax=Sphingomonas kyeonggiensis TaxID=1268553 RepID=A0A7W7K5F1_9SPHN|nr:hypothetical protein [Sphingomonas kyeonggiensis]MBB4840876.1 hypothetical protein [Sphingomonas kyeonggiensis]
MSKAMPQGATWSLPPGIVVTAEGLDPMDLEHCRNQGEKYRSPPRGTGGNVSLCLMFRNTNPHSGIGTPGSITVTIPAGLTFIPDNMSTQNGIILQKGTVEVRPGRTTYIPMYLICMNPTRDSSVAHQPFRLGPIVDHPEIRKVIAMFDGKPLPQASMAAAALGSVSTGRKIDRAVLDLIRKEWETLGVRDDPAKYL